MSASARTHAVLVLAAVLCLAVAILAAIATRVPAATGPVIDIGAPVTSEQCTPCHARIADSQTPGLNFRHAAHIVVACATCHVRMPHGPEGTERPSMQTCFGCHGQYHAEVAGTIARDGCDVCHADPSALRPAGHGADWELAPHADAARREGTNTCVMCHSAPVECDSCHRELAPDAAPVFPFYVPLMPAPEPRPELSIDLGAPVSAGQCLYCHRDIDRFVAEGRIIFVHQVHLERDYSCASCHPSTPHTPTGTRVNTMADCYRCHSLNHSGQGLVATEECGACHPPAFDLKPVAHTPAFDAGDHGDAVAEDEAYCTLCHKSPFCVACHRAQRPLPDGSPPRWVVPQDHTEAVWFSQHGPRFLERAGTCWACHDSPSCERCHQTPMPHPGEWLRTHAAYEPPSGAESDCAICHTDREWCQDCHHEQVQRLDLVEANCVPCHDEMSQKPATSIRHKAFAEHAVHFEVAESKGRPYRCYECHATWAIRPDNGHAAGGAQIGHDLRLCYDCHGALDIRSTLIAPYRGAELCARCHTEGPSARDASGAREGGSPAALPARP